MGEPRGEPFGSRSWNPPPAAPVASAPPLAPPAPPNPYKVAGTVLQDGAKRVFLTKGDRVYEARQGEELDGGYRIESIAADHVVLLYVPLDKREQLPIAATLGADVPLAEPLPRAEAAAAPLSAAKSAETAESQQAAKPAQLRWDGPQQVRAGGSFNVALRVSSSEILRATPLQLRYEPQHLEAVQVRAGKFFGQGSFSYRLNPEGSIFVGASGAGAAPGADAELVVVTFKPLKAGATAEVKLSSVALQGPAGRAIAHDRISAFRTAIQ